MPLRALLTALPLAPLALASPSHGGDSKPNFLVILADDLGYSDLGCHGSEINTPHLDSLAQNGLRFTQFYNTARCWPTRSSLISGYYPQQIRRDEGPGMMGKDYGGRGIRPDWAVLLPERLKRAGYRAYHSGKWHIDGEPLQNGFNHSYHVKDQSRFFHPEVLYLDDVKLPPVKPNSGYYLTSAVADHAVECLVEHHANHAETPFFHYLAFAAPHFPLHALPEDIEKYRDHYLSGWDTLRTRRHTRQTQLGFPTVELSALEPEVGPPYEFPEDLERLGPGEVNRPTAWENLTAVQQRFQATKMAIHAAMIDRMDQDIGRVLHQIKAMGAFDNTVICFLSDNGASAEIMVRADGHDPTAPMGAAASYLCLGPGFSSAANTPFRRHKTWVHEGGIATPFLLHWPAGISDKGSFRNAPCHVIDLVPTFLQLAGLPAHTQPPAPPLPGHSLVPHFDQAYAPRPTPLFFYHEGNRALRSDDWKIVADRTTDTWSLYDLKTDRAEQHDLRDRHPEKVRELASQFEQMASRFKKDSATP